MKQGKRKSTAQKQDAPLHVDEYIERYDADPYAAWCLMLFRLPAALAIRFQPWTKEHKLFCTYGDRRYRVTGASRLGDVWLAESFKRDIGYDHRVNVTDCKDWGAEP